MTNNELLKMVGITKEFPGVKALDNINFDLKSGEVHALLGENGAGKSTLIKVLGGIYHPESGEIYINNEKVQINDVHDAQKHGIAIIHQEIVLVQEMTIAENIFLGRELKKSGMVDFKTMNQKTQELLDRFGLKIRSTDLVKELAISGQQMVEIIKAISQNSKILVMDEPTSSISDNEVEFLFSTMRKLTQNGVGIIYISHKMSELEQICDRVTVMRDGSAVATKNVKESKKEELINLMVGRQLDNYYIRTYNDPGDIKLRVENISLEKKVQGVSFEVRKGEIVGFSGLVGAGRSELMQAIFGLRKKTGGKIYIDEKEVQINNPIQAMEHNIALVPEERKKDGIYPVLGVKYNTTIEVLKEFIKPLKLDSKKETLIATEYSNAMKVKTPSLEQEIGKLSGGNQQKVMIGRWLATKPEILILDEPTRGVDVGAKSEIYGIINELAKQNMAIIIISSELPEIINMSDRIYVMKDGEMMGQLDHNEASQEKIMKLAAR